MVLLEKWLDVVGYEGLYEVSNYGRVRSVYTKRVLSPGLSQGYFYVALYKDKKRSNKQVHRLVAEAFIPNPNNFPIINHKDEVKTNNMVENLEWCSYAYNNTYNGLAVKRGDSLKGKIAWNKGKKMPQSFCNSVSKGMIEWHRLHGQS